MYLQLGTGKTPYEIWKGKNHKLSYFYIFGSKCFILNDRDQRENFDSKSDEDIFLGYSDNSQAYRVFNIKTQTIMESANVVVDDFNDFVDFVHEEEVINIIDQN